MGCAKSISEVRAVVAAIVAKKLGVDCVTVSHGWWDRFRQRHPHLSMRAGETLAYRRATATNPETINNYFNQLEEIWFLTHLVVAHLVFTILMKVGFHFITVQAKELQYGVKSM